MYKQILTLTLALTFCLAATAQATVIDITAGIGADAASLEQSLLTSGASYTTESFESLSVGATDTGSGIDLAVGTLYGYGHVGDTTTTMDAYNEHATDGTNYWSNAAPSSTSQKGDFSIEFNDGIYSVGFYSTDFHDVGGEVTITVTTASGSETYNLYDYTGSLNSGTEVYWLVQSDEAIESIVFHQAGNDGYAIDGVTAATPIPGAAWLLGSGLLGLVGLRRRRG
jgi:hypothetical protein